MRGKSRDFGILQLRFCKDGRDTTRCGDLGDPISIFKIDLRFKGLNLRPARGAVLREEEMAQ